jgi:membrane dipeptidase
MRRLAILLVGLCLLGIGIFFGPAPQFADRMMNGVTASQDPPLAISARARDLHQRLQIADLHGDSLLWRRDLLRGTAHGHIDLPRLEAGHVTLQAFSSVTKSPKGLNYDRNSGNSDTLNTLMIAQGAPRKTWHSLLARSLHHADKLEALAASAPARFRIIRFREDLDRLVADRAAGSKVVGGLLSVEGLHNLEGRFENLDVLDKRGFRMLGLAHFFDNEVAGSVAGVNKGGLTPLGRRVIAEMERRGILIDLAHSSHQTIAEVLAIATKPLVSSHGGVKGTCNNNRNLTDNEVRGIARTGGVIAIGYWDAAVCRVSPQSTAKAMTYVRNLVGADHVALGSDFDGAVSTSLDTSQLIRITQALIDAGWSDGDIEKAMGSNFFRLLQASLPAAKRGQ